MLAACKTMIKKMRFFLLRSTKFGVSCYESHDCNFRHAINGNTAYTLWLALRKIFCVHILHRMHKSNSHALLWHGAQFRLEIRNRRQSSSFPAAKHFMLPFRYKQIQPDATKTNPDWLSSKFLSHKILHSLPKWLFHFNFIRFGTRMH